MKKIVYVLLVFLGVFFLVSCNEKVNLNLYVSEIRNGIYECKEDNFTLTVYQEKREDPLICDGYVGNFKNFLICKVESDVLKLDDVYISVNYNGKTVGSKFEFNPINAKYTAEIEVDKLVNLVNFNGELSSNGEVYKFNLKSIVVSKTINYQKALNCVSDYDKKTIDKYFGSQKINAEIHIRLLQDVNRSYYYVGIINGQGGMAYLVDGLNGKVLAKKQINNLNT